MLCDRCESHRAHAVRPSAAVSPAAVWGPHRLGDLLCAWCGAILPGEDVAQRLMRKQSQLAQFGLIGGGGPLLEPARPTEE